jgi:hypothetical protein
MPTSRRELIDLALRAAALPGGAEFFGQWLRAGQAHAGHAGGSAAPPETPLLQNYTPKFFDAADFEALQAYTEILIPTDSTPGAREAHCAAYIDHLTNASSDTPAAQKPWRDAMASLKQLGFHTADKAGREALVAAMAKPETDRTAIHAGYAAYRLIKAQNAFAFYTSRAGLIEALEYKGNSYNITFPACTHPEHQTV